MMSVELMIWLVLTIVSWGVFSFAVKYSTIFFQHAKYGVRNTLVYQPIGFTAAAIAYNYYVTGLQLTWAWQGILWAFLAGACLGLGLVFYVKAMSEKEVSIVTPLTALYPVITIILSVLIVQEHISAIHGCGIIVSIIAIWILNGGSANGKEQKLSIHEPWFRYALLTMACWGVSSFFPRLSLDYISATDGMVFQAAGYLVGGCFSGLCMTQFRPQINVLGISFALFGGISSFGGGIYYMFALEHGSLSIVAPASSLFPIVTLALARIFIGETLTVTQRFGCSLALVAVVMVNI